MSADPKTFDEPEEPHMEKQIMDEPQEEFVADQSVPSVSKGAQEEEANDEQQPAGVHAAGHQENKDDVFEPGVEG